MYYYYNNVYVDDVFYILTIFSLYLCFRVSGISNVLCTGNQNTYIVVFP